MRNQKIKEKAQKNVQLVTIFVKKTGLSLIYRIESKAAKFFESGSLLKFYSFTKTEANAVVHVVKKTRLEAVEPHPKPLCETFKVQFFAGAEEFLRKREFLQIGAKGSHGFQAEGQWMKTAGHLDAPDLSPRGGLVKDGRRSLTTCQGLLDVP